MSDGSQRGMKPEDLYAITYVGDAQITPDGRRVAYVQTRMDQEKDEYLSNIWIAPAEGGEPVQFTSGSRRDTSPRWSPDGRMLAFLSNRPGSSKSGAGYDGKNGDKSQIWLMPADGGEARQLTTLKGGAGSIAWAPDGRHIAFTSRVSTGDASEQDHDGQEKQKTARARVITTLKYKMNGEGFTYDRRPHIFVVSVEGGEPVQVTNGEYNDQAPTWSPDSRWIAFTSARHEEREFNGVSDIFVVPADGGDVRQVTPGRGPSHDAAFSPDGSTIAYYGHSDPQAGGARNTILWTIPFAGGEPHPLTDATDRNADGEGPPAWSRDGSSIYFTMADWGTTVIGVAPAAGGPVQRVAAGRRTISSWSLASNDSGIAFTATDPQNPGDVYHLRLEPAPANGSGERRLTAVNSAWLAEVTLSQPEEFTYTGSDGWTVEGWIMRPYGCEAGQTYPLLLNVHGGPHANYGWGFFDEFQVQAGAGYAVLYTNPRGSQSYGEQFAYACTRDWGGKDFQDIMAGLDYALDRFSFIDADRLGVLGGSYGGFMTSWTVGHSDRFKAAVSERAVNALYSMFGSSDIGYHFEQFEVGGTPQEALDYYIEHSPLTYAKNVVTPLMIMHSENDLRCPMEQAEQFYVTLKVLGKTDVVFVRFPEESHELSRSGKPSRRVERFQLILDWFDRYLRRNSAAPRAEKLAQAVSTFA